MEEPTPSPREPGADLFDRWLAHRDGLAAPPQPRTSVEDTLEPAPEPEAEEARRAQEALLQAEREADAATEAVAVAEPARPREPAMPVEVPAAPLDAAHEVLAAFAAAKVTPTRQPAAAPAPSEPPLTPAPAAVAVRAPDLPSPSRNVTFKPKHGARPVVGLLLVAVVAATAYAGSLAYEAQTTESIVVTAGLGVFALALWAIRAGSPVSRLSVTNGQLEISNASGRFVFDLTSAYMPIEVVGTPGQRKWKVLFVRRRMAPFTVDSSMVDPEKFMAVLRDYRPERDDT